MQVNGTCFLCLSEISKLTREKVMTFTTLDIKINSPIIICSACYRFSKKL